MKEGYKKTAIGNIPIDWSLNTVGDVIKFEGGAQPPKEHFVNEEKEGYIRLIQIRDYKTDEYMTYIPKDMARKFCTEDDIMIGRYGPPIFQILRGLEGAYNVALLKAIPDEGVLNREYARYFLSTEKLFKLIDRLSQRTSGQTGVDMEALNNYLIPIPPLKEQEKIAEILSTVDCQIDDTEKLIEKCRVLKKGLMQRLLTTGIGHTEFKKTEIGEIPVGWEVDNDFIKIFSGFGFKYSEYSYEGIPLIRINNVTHGKILDEDWSYLPNEYKEEYKEYVIKKGDVLLALNRPITQGKLKICIVNIEEAILYQRVGKLIMDSDIYCPTFYYYYMQSEKFMKKLESGLVGTDQPYIKNSEFKDIKFPIPSLDEQLKIVEVLSYVDNEIEEYENRKQKLEELKKGLMQQLLTGNIRTMK